MRVAAPTPDARSKSAVPRDAIAVARGARGATRLASLSSRGTAAASDFAVGAIVVTDPALRCAPLVVGPRRLASAQGRQHAPIVVNAVTPLRLDAIDAGLQPPALRDCVARAIRRYLQDLGEHRADDLYRLVLSEVEAPLFAEVLRHCRGNQTRAAQMLGITRATLRKKLADARRD